MTGGELKGAGASDQATDKQWEEFIEKIEAAGWSSGGGFNPGGETHVTFYRRDGLYNLSPEETAILLGLVDEEGQIISGHDEFDERTGQTERFGYDVETDQGTGEVVVAYSGPDDEKYQAFLERLLALGHVLNGQQETEVGEFKMKLARYVSLPIFRHEGETASEFLRAELMPMRATNKLIGQIATAESDNGTIEMMVQAGIPRAEAIAGVVNLVATTFTQDVGGYEGEVAALKLWHRHVDYRYTKLLEALQAQHSGKELLEDFIATNPVLETLGGIREGVRQTLSRSQERADRLQLGEQRSLE